MVSAIERSFQFIFKKPLDPVPDQVRDDVARGPGRRKSRRFSVFSFQEIQKRCWLLVVGFRGKWLWCWWLGHQSRPGARSYSHQSRPGARSYRKSNHGGVWVVGCWFSWEVALVLVAWPPIAAGSPLLQEKQSWRGVGCWLLVFVGSGSGTDEAATNRGREPAPTATNRGREPAPTGKAIMAGCGLLIVGFCGRGFQPRSVENRPRMGLPHIKT